MATVSKKNSKSTAPSVDIDALRGECIYHFDRLIEESEARTKGLTLLRRYLCHIPDHDPQLRQLAADPNLRQMYDEGCLALPETGIDRAVCPEQDNYNVYLNSMLSLAEDIVSRDYEIHGVQGDFESWVELVIHHIAEQAEGA